MGENGVPAPRADVSAEQRKNFWPPMHADARKFNALSVCICVHRRSILLAVRPPVRTLRVPFFMVDLRLNGKLPPQGGQMGAPARSNQTNSLLK
jgi:hypothetical protein